MSQIRSSFGLIALLLSLASSACTAAGRDEPVPPDTIWSEPPTVALPRSRIAFRDRADGHTYGLPTKGQASIKDLLAVLPTQGIGFSDPDIFVAPETQKPGGTCRGGEPTIAKALPITVDAVVTLYPRAYLKLGICGQDERFYGSYTIEDDTGGIVVLRDSRVAPFTFGDRVRLTVSSLMLTYGPDPDTRAVLMANVDGIEKTGGAAVLFVRTDAPFTQENVGRVHRVEGYVVGVPSNDNFNKLLLSNKPIAQRLEEPERVPDDRINCALVCEATCENSDCGTAPGLCAPVCTNLCMAAPPGALVPAASLPMCWIVGLSSELGRRGLTYTYGQHLQVTGPVVHQFDRQIWVQDPTQILGLPSDR